MKKVFLILSLLLSRLLPIETILRAIAFNFAALLLPSVGQAADPGWVSFCERYANDAVAASKKNIDLKCGFRGPRWTTSREDHFNWCLSQGGVSAEPAREGLFRVKGLKDCEMRGRVMERPRDDVTLIPILSAHNWYRAKHCVPNLTWSAELAEQAQAWASTCTADGDGFAHSKEAWSSESGFGENMYWGPSATAKNAIDWWYGESKRYNFKNPIASFQAAEKDRNKDVRHFTQVVWRNTTQLGCAEASCSGKNVWVCRYLPTGNWNANNPGVLTNNVPPPCK